MLQTAPALASFPPVPAPDWAQLCAQREYLVRFAARRLLDPALAEDLVHDVFEAVMTGRARFAGRAALRSWLVAVLKNKIVDLIRERSGHDSLDACDEAGAAIHEFECPQPRPDERAEQRQRLERALARIAALPAGLRQAFEHRVLRDESTEEVCSALAISEDNLFVRLHRARRQLAS
ncbi:MAG: sigma-70 family RNA polymerase sigma factor [Burkholderiales bacterium]|nr:sigma-70 family RNA polymerase sigma factor [Burkholderiales bacterium]MDE2452772.1 sigma-70 family RNA polymerase sigma factor [Burkholderiales bacterium]